MPYGLNPTEKELGWLVDDGVNPWVLEVFRSGLHDRVYYRHGWMDSKEYRRANAHIAALASYILENVEVYEVSPFAGAIADWLNDTETPKYKATTVWLPQDVSNIISQQQLEEDLALHRHTDNPSFIEYLRDHPQVTSWVGTD